MRESRSGSASLDTHSPRPPACTPVPDGGFEPATPPRAGRAPTCGGDLGAPWPRLIPCRTAHRSRVQGCGGACSRAGPAHSLRGRRLPRQAASGTRAALRHSARRGCRRGGTGMCWLPRQRGASGHRLLEPTGAPPLARPPRRSAPPTAATAPPCSPGRCCCGHGAPL